METNEIKKEIEPQVQVYVSSLPAKITDMDSYLSFADELKIIKSKMAAIDDRLEPAKKKARAAWQEWVDLIDELKAPLVAREKYNKSELLRWNKEQEAIQKKKEEEARAQAKKDEEDRQLAAAAAAEQRGDTKAAEEIINTPVYVPPVVAQKEVPKVSGISFKKTWTYRIIDESLIPNMYKMINEKMIAAVAKNSGGVQSIPGVEFYEVEGVAAGRK